MNVRVESKRFMVQPHGSGDTLGWVVMDRTTGKVVGPKRLDYEVTVEEAEKLERARHVE